MRAPYFDVAAECRRCSPGEFTVQRKKVTKINTCDQQYTISQVVCPKCRMWADISKISKVTA